MRSPASRARGSPFRNQADAKDGYATLRYRVSTPEEPRLPKSNLSATNRFLLPQIQPWHHLHLVVGLPRAREAVCSHWCTPGSCCWVVRPAGTECTSLPAKVHWTLVSVQRLFTIAKAKLR